MPLIYQQRGLVDKASASQVQDCGFKSRRGCFFALSFECDQMKLCGLPDLLFQQESAISVPSNLCVLWDYAHRV